MSEPADLHSRLVAEVLRRLEVARAATPGPWSPDKPWLSDVVNSALLGPVADCSIGTGYRAQSLEDARHIALQDPGDAIRRYGADLRRLERHAPRKCVGFWPCNEVRDLAASLGVEVTG
jgi:hypothetical protein